MAGEQKGYRWSANRKMSVVLRLLRGEPMADIIRHSGVSRTDLILWKKKFLQMGSAGLKARPSGSNDVELRLARRQLEELTLENELLRRRLTETDHPLR